MSKISIPGAFTTRISNLPSPCGLLRIVALAVVSLVLSLSAVQAADLDEQYLSIFNLIEQADTFQKTGDPAKALVKYREAEAALATFRRNNPGWNPKLVTYRWNDLASKIAVAQDASASGATKPATPGATAAPSTPGAVKPAAVTSSAPQVKLLEPGAEPRKLLRLAPKAGDKQTLGMTVKIGMQMKMAEMEMPAMKIPAISSDTAITIKEVSPTGDITYETAVSDSSIAEDGDAEPQVVEAMKGALDGIKGMSGSGKMSNRGIGLGADMKVPSGVNPQARQTIDQMKESWERVSSPLPEEAVGPGAKWEAKTTVKAQGMTISQTATYELVSLDGDRATIASTVNQTAANQKITNPSMPGVKVEVAKMSSKGAGKMILDLSKILPLEATMDIKTAMTMKVPTGGDEQTMDMNMDMNLKMESK